MSVGPLYPVDENGDIGFNRDEGIYLLLSERDGNGDPVNINTHPRYFNINGGMDGRYTLTSAAPSFPNNAYLVLTTAQLAVVKNGFTCRFTLTDESGLVPLVLWEGILYERPI